MKSFWMALPLVVFANSAAAQQTVVTCVLSSAEGNSAAEIAASCGTTKEEVDAIHILSEKSARRQTGMLARQEESKRLIVSTLMASENYSGILDSGITEEAILSLADKIAGQVDNPRQGFSELEKFVDIAIDTRESLRSNPSADGLVTAVSKKVADLNDFGNFEDGYAEAIDALKVWQENRTPRIERGIELAQIAYKQAILSRSALAMASASIQVFSLEAERLAIENENDFENLSRQDLENVYFWGLIDQTATHEANVASRLGLQLFSRSAALTTSAAAQRSQNDNFSADLWNSSGIFWQTTYSLSADPVTILHSQEAFQEALQLVTRSSQADHWATAQHGLGVSLRYQSEHTSTEDKFLLEKALVHLQSSLQVRTAIEFPLLWAETENARANVLVKLAELEGETSTSLREEAAEIYRNLIASGSRSVGPAYDVAVSNLASVLGDLSHDYDDERALATLEEAVQLMSERLQVYSPEEETTKWLSIVEGAGTATAQLGAHVGGAEGRKHLLEAIGLFELGLEHATFERLPVLWTTLKSNTSAALLDLAELESGAERDRFLEMAERNLADLRETLSENALPPRFSAKVQRMTARTNEMRATQ